MELLTEDESILDEDEGESPYDSLLSGVEEDVSFAERGGDDFEDEEL